MRGMRKGRPRALTPAQVLRLEVEWGQRSAREWAKLLGVSRVTIYNYAERRGIALRQPHRPSERTRYRAARPPRKLGRPRKFTPAMIREMRVGWLTQSTHHWMARFNASRATVMSVAKIHHFPPRPKGPRDYLTVEPKGPTPTGFRCEVCLARYSGERCPNGPHSRQDAPGSLFGCYAR